MAHTSSVDENPGQLNIKPDQRNGAYRDVLTFLFSSGLARYGSAANAAVHLIRGTTEFQAWAATAAAPSDKRL